MVNKLTGDVFVNAKLDYELKSQYVIEIGAVDPELDDYDEANELSCPSIKLVIDLLDVNDNEPRFARANQTIIFRETFPLGQELTKFGVSDLDSANRGGSPFTFIIMEQHRSLSDSPAELVQLIEPVFAINPNGSLILIKKPFRNQTYLARVRCYDSGNPPLHADTHLTIKVTDESSNEPVLNDTQIEILTIGGLDELDSDLLVRVEPDGRL